MIKKLRTKFIILSMGSLLLLLGIIVISSNFWNYLELVANADRVLGVLAENMPEPLEKKWLKDGEVPPYIPPQGRGWGNRHMSPEILYESRFFTVDISEDGELLTINTENIAMVDQEEAAQYAQIASRKKSDKGFVGEFRYLKVYRENDIHVKFLDCGRNLSSFRGTLFTNCMIS